MFAPQDVWQKKFQEALKRETEQRQKMESHQRSMEKLQVFFKKWRVIGVLWENSRFFFLKMESHQRSVGKLQV